MHLFITLLLIFIPISIVLAYFAKGKKVRDTVRLYLGIGKEKAAKLLYEVRRKTFHLVGILIPGLYYLGLKFGLMSRVTSLTILGFFLVSILLAELLRHNFTWFREFLNAHISGIMRAHEHKKFFGSTWYLIGSFATMYLFNPTIAIAAILFLNLGDLAAAVFGITYGKSKLFGTRKSFEGSLACFITCFLIGLVIFRGVHMCEYIAVSGALAATIAELIPGIDDNVTIPVLSAIAMTLAVKRVNVELPMIGTPDMY